MLLTFNGDVVKNEKVVIRSTMFGGKYVPGLTKKMENFSITFSEIFFKF